MKNGLAIWHYPHRSTLENVAYFADCGFESVSLIGFEMFDVCKDKAVAEKLAELIISKGIVLTVHGRLPHDHSEESVSYFKDCIDAFGQWQKQYGCLSVLSFDVMQDIRDNMTPYIDYVLEKVENAKIAVEDFGLNKSERKQIEHLKNNLRFGYLIDIGHMYIRICGKNNSGYTLFTNSPEECPINENPGFEEFFKAMQSKEFPIFEIHLHNNDGENDLHHFLEDGTLKIDVIADVLKKMQYDGVLTLEAAPTTMFKCENPDKGINDTYSYWKKLNT